MRQGSLFGREKLFAVPWGALMIDEAHKDFVLDVDQEMLKNAPGFDRDNWPSEPDPTFARSVEDYYAQQGYSRDEGYSQGHSRQEGTQGGYTSQEESMRNPEDEPYTYGREK